MPCSKEVSGVRIGVSGSGYARSMGRTDIKTTGSGAKKKRDKTLKTHA